MTQPSGSKINSDLLRPLFQTSWRFYLLVAIFGGIVGLGLLTWMAQMYLGFGVSGIRWPVYWGFYVTSFVFWIGISHAGTLISAILRLVNAGWRRPVTRCAEVITAFALMIGAMFPHHSPRASLAGVLAHPVPQRTADLAELQVAARVGLLRDQRRT